MQSSDYWRLCDHLSIFQSIMLILGYDPENQTSYQVENHKRASLPTGYGALKTALINAALSKHIVGTLAYENFDYRGNLLDKPILDIDQSILLVDSLREYLGQRGLKEGFFFPEGSIFEDYLNPRNSFFAPKLAASIYAWKAITENQSALSGRTPKQALEKWLRENANKYGLTKEDGTPNETGIQEICKIANWKPEGGAAKTPNHSIVQDNSPTPAQKPQKLKIFGSIAADLDEIFDEIPF